MAWIGAIALAGILIGLTGVGGVLVVPVLHELRGVDLRSAIAAASLAFGLPGLIALARMRREKGVLPGGALGLIGCTIPGALLGSMFVHAADARFLLATLGLGTVAIGLWGLKPQESSLAGPSLTKPAAWAIGCGVGFASAITGTGGPVVLWPIMMAARQDIRSSLMIAQAIQLPIAICASAIHITSGGVDLKLSLLVGGILVAGALLGQSASRYLSAKLLRTAICILLIATGTFYLYRVSA